MSRIKYEVRAITCDYPGICLAELELGAGTPWPHLVAEAKKLRWRLARGFDLCPQHCGGKP